MKRFTSIAFVTLLFMSHSMHMMAQQKRSVENPGNGIRGAIYVPFHAYNAPQMWKNFDTAETRRDFGYARELHLNALRIWASYEYWKIAPDDFDKKLNTMLDIAHENGIRVLLSIFEMDGTKPTPQNMWDTNPHTAFDVQSPGNEWIAPQHKENWEPPRQFLIWFMKKYGSDHRLLAIEVMNEPRGDETKGEMPFAMSMFQTAKSMQGTVPLTIGSASMENAKKFLPMGLDIIEYHDNFPKLAEGFDSRLAAAVELGKKTGKPIWITEWQRLRPSGVSGFGAKPLPEDEKGIDYASLANEVSKYPVGNFFWCLMVKPAYLKPQRNNGTVNGLFWPDGSVWSLKDARAIANDSTLQLTEKLPPKNFLDTDQNPQ